MKSSRPQYCAIEAAAAPGQQPDGPEGRRAAERPGAHEDAVRARPRATTAAGSPVAHQPERDREREQPTGESSSSNVAPLLPGAGLRGHRMLVGCGWRLGLLLLVVVVLVLVLVLGRGPARARAHAECGVSRCWPADGLSRPPAAGSVAVGVCGGGPSGGKWVGARGDGCGGGRGGKGRPPSRCHHTTHTPAARRSRTPRRFCEFVRGLIHEYMYPQIRGAVMTKSTVGVVSSCLPRMRPGFDSRTVHWDPSLFCFLSSRTVHLDPLFVFRPPGQYLGIPPLFSVLPTP